MKSKLSWIRLWHLCCLVSALQIMLIACSHQQKVKVLLPPVVDLKTYPSIGVFEFSTNEEERLKPYVTQSFIENILSAQPGTRILELGNVGQVLRSLGYSEINSETIQSIGKKYSVDAIIFGQLQISQIKPKISLSTALKSCVL